MLLWVRHPGIVRAWGWRVSILAALALLAGCGGGSSSTSPPPQSPHFQHFNARADDLVSLAGDLQGAVYGAGAMSAKQTVEEASLLATLASRQGRALDQLSPPPQLSHNYRALKRAVRRAERSTRSIARRGPARARAALRRARRGLLRDSHQILRQLASVTGSLQATSKKGAAKR